MSNAPFHSVVYGPLKTRRLGIALGINPVPTATGNCLPDCVFCKTGQADAVPIVARINSVPSAGVIVTAAARRIIGMSKASEKIVCIVLSGNLDPTRHHQLLTITENLRDLRNKWFPKADLAILTDGTNLDPLTVKAGNDAPMVTITNRDFQLSALGNDEFALRELGYFLRFNPRDDELVVRGPAWSYYLKRAK